MNGVDPFGGMGELLRVGAEVFQDQHGDNQKLMQSMISQITQHKNHLLVKKKSLWNKGKCKTRHFIQMVLVLI
jgi:hypothetical protein